jgi:hypothetical protein
MSLRIAIATSAVVKGSEKNYGKEISYLKLIPEVAEKDSALVSFIKEKGMEIAEFVRASKSAGAAAIANVDRMTSDNFVEFLLNGSWQNDCAVRNAGYKPSEAVTKSDTIAEDL